MYLQHSPQIWREFPELVPGILLADGVTPDAKVDAHTARYLEIARSRLARAPESELPEIQAWRRAFGRMGLKPTQYRCASESLLRRFRKEGMLQRLHPLVDLCNSISLAFAIPVAALDVAMIAGGLEVRRATGTEDYLTFAGEVEHPGPGEVIFADEAGHAHARRWTNRQSGHSAIRASTTTALIVTEAMHATAATDIPALVMAMAAELSAVWPIVPVTAFPGADSPRVTLTGQFRPAPPSRLAGPWRSGLAEGEERTVR